MEERSDSEVSLGELLCIKTFACINDGRLKTVEKGQIHPRQAQPKVCFCDKPLDGHRLVSDEDEVRGGACVEPNSHWAPSFRLLP